MDFSSILGSGSSNKESGHPATILTTVQNNGVYKLYTDVSGHVERTEITLPEGRVLIIKDYEKLAALSHYRRVTILSPQDITLGTLSIVPEDRKRPSSTSRFFDGNTLVGTGNGNIGIAIASQLTTISVDPMKLSRSSVDPNVITSIKGFLQGKR